VYQKKNINGVEKRRLWSELGMGLRGGGTPNRGRKLWTKAWGKTRKGLYGEDLGKKTNPLAEGGWFRL